MKLYTGFRLPPNSMTLDDLERQNRGFYGFFCDIGLRKSISFTRRRHRRQRQTRLWPMCIMVPMGRVQVICDFRNYNYWTGNAIGFCGSREVCSNFLLLLTRYSCAVRRLCYGCRLSSLSVFCHKKKNFLQESLCGSSPQAKFQRSIQGNIFQIRG